MTDILLNASNLHIGGGVPVATSAIGEFDAMSDLPTGMAIWASTAAEKWPFKNE